MSLCKYCGKDKKLIKAHVIPECFFPLKGDNTESPILISNSEKQPYPAKRPIGEYDPNILCKSCEKLFEKVDDYGSKVLIDKFKELFNPVYHRNETLAYVSDKIDKPMLLRFFVSVLWRAGVSNRAYYQKVLLGPYEQYAKNAIEDETFDEHKRFDAIITKWTAKNTTYETLQIRPFCHKIQGVNSYRFYFNAFTVEIRSDKRTFGEPFDTFGLKNGASTVILTREIENSKELAAIRQVVRKSK